MWQRVRLGQEDLVGFSLVFTLLVLGRGESDTSIQRYFHRCWQITAKVAVFRRHR